MDNIVEVLLDFFKPCPVEPDSDWAVARAMVKERLGDTNLKRAVDQKWMADYVRILLQAWSPQILKTWVAEVRAYRRDHRFFECV